MIDKEVVYGLMRFAATALFVWGCFERNVFLLAAAYMMVSLWAAVTYK